MEELSVAVVKPTRAALLEGEGRKLTLVRRFRIVEKVCRTQTLLILYFNLDWLEGRAKMLFELMDPFKKEQEAVLPFLLMREKRSVLLLLQNPILLNQLLLDWLSLARLVSRSADVFRRLLSLKEKMSKNRLH